MVPDLDFKVQYEEPNPALTEWLKGHEPGQRGRVLLATKSFFTGVDVPGEALSLVIITKMPFPVPDEPLTQARCEAIEAAGGSSFRDFTIPVMSLVLQQATGRLIRHREDRGVVAILDPRIQTKGYGKTVLRDLPPMGKVFDLPEVESFLARASA
jgi:ATP-dependent DNA helicase DinG